MNKSYVIIAYGILPALLFNSLSGSASAAALSWGSSQPSNIKGVLFGDSTLTQKEGGYSVLPGTPPSTDSRLTLIASNGFNTIRVAYFWEAYEKNPTAFLA